MTSSRRDDAQPGAESLDITGSRPTRPWLTVVLAGLGLAAVAVAWMIVQGLEHPVDPAPIATTDPTPIPPAAGFTGSVACAECHGVEYERWRASQHAVAMQVADETTVLGNFDGARFRNFGVTSEFFRRDGKFMVRTDGPDGKLADFEIRHTFGVYPLQQYLIELPGGHVQALSIAWDTRPQDQGGQRWFHLYPNERIDHRDELHWTQRQQNWNFMCSDCHSTNVQKNYDAVAHTFATTFSEVSVGCEACHGPGSVHVGLARSAASSGEPMSVSGLTVNLDERRGAAWVIDPATGNAARSAPRTTEKELDVCAQCHARRGQFSNGYQAGEPLQDHYLPALLSEGLYHPDGQQRDEVFNWGSFVSSRMYANGVTCGDCHEPHGGQLHAPGNGVCAQCHSATKYDAASHHFHEAGTPGAACAACHMKTETYMVVDPRHDHSFRIPRPDLSASLGVPNACNQCHADRKADWAAAEIRKRYPEPKPGFQGFADAFAAADRRDAAASIALTQVTANLDESAIARASAIERLARSPGENTILAAEAGLKDPSPQVRRAAIAAFEVLPPLQRRAVMPLLSDPVRTVRMQAARTLALLADDAFDSPESLAAFRRAADEFIAAERFNADRPEHRTNLGGFFADRGEMVVAEEEYRAALRLDTRFVPAWANLADLMRLQGREIEAESILREGLELSPRDATLHHALGLSLVRQQRGPEALRELKRATDLDPRNERFAYVYEVAREELGKDAAKR
jgi:tetratricopeptide (TPR) repeat protein